MKVLKPLTDEQVARRRATRSLEDHMLHAALTAVERALRRRLREVQEDYERGLQGLYSMARLSSSYEGLVTLDIRLGLDVTERTACPEFSFDDGECDTCEMPPGTDGQAHL